MGSNPIARFFYLIGIRCRQFNRDLQDFRRWFALSQRDGQAERFAMHGRSRGSFLLP